VLNRLGQWWSRSNIGVTHTAAILMATSVVERMMTEDAVTAINEAILMTIEDVDTATNAAASKGETPQLREAATSNPAGKHKFRDRC